MTIISDKQLLEKLYFEFCTFSIFPALETKKLVLVSKILRRFDIILHTAYMFNSFLVSLDVAVMTNILYEVIKILYEKMLNAIMLNIHIDAITIHQRKIPH